MDHAAIVGSALLLMLVNAGFSNRDWTQTRDQIDSYGRRRPHGVAAGPGAFGRACRSTASARSRAASRHVRLFAAVVIVSMHLLTVLIGAGYMARTKRRATSLLVRTATARPTRKHGFFAMVGLVKGIGDQPCRGGVCISGVLTNPKLAGEGAVGEFLQRIAALPSWVLPALGLLFLVNALLIGVVFSWQKWGAIGLLIVPLIQGLVLHNGGAPTIATAIFVLLAIVPALALILILTSLASLRPPGRRWNSKMNLLSPIFPLPLSARRGRAVRARRRLHGDEAERARRLMGIELVLNGANLNFIAFGSPYLRESSLGLDGN